MDKNEKNNKLTKSLTNLFIAIIIYFIAKYSGLRDFDAFMVVALVFIGFELRDIGKCLHAHKLDDVI